MTTYFIIELEIYNTLKSYEKSSYTFDDLAYIEI